MKRIEKRGPNEDRRSEDVGPPSGWRDRRRHVERRIPTTEEVEVSEEEWETYFVNPPKKSAGPEPAQVDAAADPFPERPKK